MKQHIPIHKLDESDGLGLKMFHFESESRERATLLGAHRDDHYIFLLQEQGHTGVMLDFKTVTLEGAGLLYILPGQVHHILFSELSSGWFVAISTHLVPEEYRQVLEHAVVGQDAVILNEMQQEKFRACIQLINERYMEINQPLSKQILYSMISAYIGMFAETYLQDHKSAGQQNSRPVQLTRQFRNLLLQNFKTIKGPAEYAAMLNISLTYLNEVVKSITGFPVSYWIHHELILEARRLLYYTDLSLKEIAFSLGFADHTYFSRLFTKTAGISAGKFRRSYR